MPEDENLKVTISAADQMALDAMYAAPITHVPEPTLAEIFQHESAWDDALAALTAHDDPQQEEFDL